MNNVALARIGLLVAAAMATACADGNTPEAAGVGGGATVTGGPGGGEGGYSPLEQLGGPQDPTTCEAAASRKSYVGCDFWPTVTANGVWSIFDFAVVVANTGKAPTDVTIQGPGGLSATTTVAPLDTTVLYLPWSPALKGADSDACGSSSPPDASVGAPGAAYHLTSTTPIIVYQFSALEFRGIGGPPGKDWSSCPGNQICEDEGAPIGCFSYSNDASILLPSTAMSGSYRLLSVGEGKPGVFLAVTGTQAATTVQVELASGASVVPGGPVGDVPPGGTFSFTLEAGDVVQVVSDGSGDLGGTLVTADKPVQVVSGSSCTSITFGDIEGSCDHVEETVQPAETLGKHYVLPTPSGALGAAAGHHVRLFGNADGTTLTWSPAAPNGAPSVIDAGEVIDLGLVTTDLEVTGDKEIAVATFLASASQVNADDRNGRGDPSQSQAVATEQFRTSYVFLAPLDYDVNLIDVTMPLDAVVTLDEAPLPATPTPIGSSGFGVARVRLGEGRAGAHALRSDKPVGVQVLGYGAYTSYQYPAGLDLKYIAPPPN
jgi:hypothetical protein